MGDAIAQMKHNEAGFAKGSCNFINNPKYLFFYSLALDVVSRPSITDTSFKCCNSY